MTAQVLPFYFQYSEMGTIVVYHNIIYRYKIYLSALRLTIKKDIFVLFDFSIIYILTLYLEYTFVHINNIG